MNDENITSEAACAEVEPLVFDNYQKPKHALKYCAVCPVRGWCLRQVDPIESFFDGIAGGHVWRDGVHREGSLKDPVLREYVSSSRHRLKTSKPRKRGERKRTDRVLLGQFLSGKVPNTLLTEKERALAAAWLISQGWSEDDAVKHCNVKRKGLG